MQKIISKDISVVVQGPVHKRKTKKCLQSIRTNLPEAEIILSTWKDSDVNGLDYDVLVLNDDPNNVKQERTKKKILCNINRMVVSTNEGLKKVSRKYTLKLRTDAYIDNTSFIDIFDKFPRRGDKYKLFNQRIATSTLFTKTANKKQGKMIEIPFHLSDWWFFGDSDDVKKLLLASEVTEEPYFSNYFEYPQNRNKNSVYEKFSWKWASEQYIGYSCFSKYFDDIRMEDCSDISDDILEKSKLCLINNFIFTEFKQSGISNQKYKCSKCELFYGDQYLYLLTFSKFESEYKKYCDNFYTPKTRNLLLENREIGYRILRFYKHLFKLIDSKTPFVAKLEQLFIGIPVSGITLIPTLLKIIMEKK